MTLKLAAQHADIWNGFGPPATFKHKCEVLDNWCHEVGRDPAVIERSCMISPSDLPALDSFVEAGATHLVLRLDELWDFRAVERLVQWRNRR